MSNSYIERLHVKSVRQFNELNIEFNQGFNFIAGPNGCGKTSILACISHCFDYENLNYSRFNLESEFWTDIVVNNSLFRVGIPKNSVMNFDSYRQSRTQAIITAPQQSNLNRKSISIHEFFLDLKDFCPLFIGANRNIKYTEIQGTKKEATREQQYGIYIKNSTRSLYGDWNSSIKQWLCNRYFIIDKDWAIEEKQNWCHLIESLPTIGPFDSHFSFVRIERNLEPIFSIYGKECYLEELSSGFQSVLSIIANIFEWIEGSKKEGNRNVKQATGSVLIDELDLHLHPEWQFTLRDGLKRIFPKLQFIVTTHSPHLLASAKQNEVIIMPKNSTNEIYNLSPSPRTYNGWNTDQILSEIMDVRSLENKDYERLITKAFEWIEQRSIPGLENTIKSLEKICHPSDTIVTVLKTRLASMVALQDD